MISRLERKVQVRSVIPSDVQLERSKKEDGSNRNVLLQEGLRKYLVFPVLTESFQLKERIR